MPILGVGTDIVETERIRIALRAGRLVLSSGYSRKPSSITRSASLRSIFTWPLDSRQKRLWRRLWAVLSDGSEVEVVNNANGKPMVNLYGRAREAAGNATVHLSVSHTKHYASAVAVVEVGE